MQAFVAAILTVREQQETAFIAKKLGDYGEMLRLARGLEILKIAGKRAKMVIDSETETLTSATSIGRKAGLPSVLFGGSHTR